MTGLLVRPITAIARLVVTSFSTTRGLRASLTKLACVEYSNQQQGLD